MNVVLCDTCNESINGNAFEFHYVRGRVVPAEQGRPRMKTSGQGRLLYLCEPCGQWVDRAIDHLRAERVRN